MTKKKWKEYTKIEEITPPHSEHTFHLHWFYVVIVVIVISSLTFSYFHWFEAKVESLNEIPPAPHKEEKLVDFPNTEAGTFGGILKATYGKQPPEEVLVLFASVKIPGLTILYYPYQRQLVAGTPQMVAEDVALFDGREHELYYTFKNGDKQILYCDQKPIAISKFVLPEKNLLSGMVIGAEENFISPAFEMIEIIPRFQES